MNVRKLIGGEKLYQKRARRALPILVRQAMRRQAIPRSSLAAELGMPTSRNLEFVLARIGATLDRLSTLWGEAIPPIKHLVFDDARNQPNDDSPLYPSGNGDGRRATSTGQNRKVTHSELDAVFAYARWSYVLKALTCKSQSEY